MRGMERCKFRTFLGRRLLRPGGHHSLGPAATPVSFESRMSLGLAVDASFGQSGTDVFLSFGAFSAQFLTNSVLFAPRLRICDCCAALFGFEMVKMFKMLILRRESYVDQLDHLELRSLHDKSLVAGPILRRL